MMKKYNINFILNHSTLIKLMQFKLVQFYNIHLSTVKKCRG